MYRLVMVMNDSTVVKSSALACDNNKSEFGYEDRSIERKAKMLAKRIEKFDDVDSCKVEQFTS
ncbi:hypothetical protein pp2_313 [Vibrio phage phi-pp2]|nr:hypothetical protein pp2_313 [Vibrio phage phi-pp2]